MLLFWLNKYERCYFFFYQYQAWANMVYTVIVKPAVKINRYFCSSSTPAGMKLIKLKMQLREGFHTFISWCCFMNHYAAISANLTIIRAWHRIIIQTGNFRSSTWFPVDVIQMMQGDFFAFCIFSSRIPITKISQWLIVNAKIPMMLQR